MKIRSSTVSSRRLNFSSKNSINILEFVISVIFLFNVLGIRLSEKYIQSDFTVNFNVSKNRNVLCGIQKARCCDFTTEDRSQSLSLSDFFSFPHPLLHSSQN